jgi:hypothetical protein
MASLFTKDTLPVSSEEAIREFNEKYLAVISASAPTDWFSRFVLPVGSPRTTFPLTAFSSRFVEAIEEQGRFKTMKEKTVDVSVVEYKAGHEVKVLDLLTQVFAYRNWSQVPSRFVAGEANHVAKNLAALLEAGTSSTCAWDGLSFFSTAHLANPGEPTLGTFSNYNSAGTDPAVIANITTEVTAMRGVLDVDGNKLGVEPDTILLPTGKFQAVSNLLEQAMIGNGESNPYLGKFQCVHVKELADVNDWYLVDSKMIAMGMDPMTATNYRPAESLGLRFKDESSDFFKDTGKISVSAHIWYGFALLFPHAIRRIAGA